MAAKSGIRTGLRALGFSSPTMSNTISQQTIRAIPRDSAGKKFADTERSIGRIPAVILNRSSKEKTRRGSNFGKHLISMEKKQILDIINSVELPFFCSTRFDIQIRTTRSSGAIVSGKVLPIKIHRDNKSGDFMNMMFVWANDKTKLEVSVPLVFKGEDVSPGLLKGGRMKRMRTSIRLVCRAEVIPAMIEVDVSNLDLGEQIFMRDLGISSSLKLLSENSAKPICKLVSTKLEIADPESDHSFT